MEVDIESSSHSSSNEEFVKTGDTGEVKVEVRMLLRPFLTLKNRLGKMFFFYFILFFFFLMLKNKEKYGLSH